MLASPRLLLFAWILAAAAAGVARAESVAQVDLRVAPEPDPISRFVVLCARKSEPWGTGHSFVVWITHDARTNQTDARGFGFYPGTQRVLVKLAGGKGQLLNEASSDASSKAGLLTHRLIFQVDKQHFDASWSTKQEWETARPHYNLLARNCTHFTHQVGQSLGLRPPKPVAGERPPFYFDRLLRFCRDLP